MHIEVASEVIAQIGDEARAVHPHECCGILLGEGACIARALPTRNVHAEPARHFEIDPQALIDAHRAAREGGPQVLGYYHSHPTGTAEPSATDQSMAAGDGRVWAIIATGEIRFWRDDAAGFQLLSYVEIAG
ncbi:M67 family metallopeptidase [Altererythrobacter sp. BO-6]|uniref:M67 family metallopeptidase n=1 Tax=Altererythrobacter sp. BO-6 TaxID=2604537 RepID=UPI0013E1E7FC|nr:M67 family metallopeptidase [Altererythrobacter sp. BO-6]QIG54795.1 M67 family metallopeptidase [Altererythrobacter sp. BO-6]